MKIEGLIIGDNIYEVKNSAYRKELSKLKKNRSNWKDYQKIELDFVIKLMSKMSDNLKKWKLISDENHAGKGEKAALGCTNPCQYHYDRFSDNLLKLVAVIYNDDE